MLIKKQLITTAIAVSSVALGWAIQAMPAAAAAITCPDGLGSLIDPTDPNPQLTAKCQYSGTLSDDNEIALFNDELFFGKNDWILAGKDSSAQGQSGTINLIEDLTPDANSDVVDLINVGRQGPGKPTDLLLSFKGDNQNSGLEPGTIVAYLLKVPNNGGIYNWQTPFSDPDGTKQDVSRISLFYRAPADGVPVPTPALLPGLVGMGVAAVRKRKATIEP